MADNQFTNDLAAITKSVTSPDATTLMNLARQRGNDVATQNAILNDRAALTPFQFQTKYGQGVAGQVDQLDVNADSLARFADTHRTAGEQASDIGSNVGVGLLNSLGGAVTLGSRVFGRDAANAVAQTIQGDSQFLQGEQTPEMRAQQKIAGMSAQLDKADNDAQYSKDVKSDGTLTAELRSFGRSATDAASRLYQNPTVLESGLSQGVGSILAAAPTAGMLGTLSQIGKNVAARAVGAAESTIPTMISAESTGLIPQAITNNGSVSAAIGVMEGGNSYANTVNEIMGMSHDDLVRNSPNYRAYLASGVSQEEARRMVADAGAIRAAAIQGPLSALSGKLVSGFEGAPLATHGLTHTVKDILKEGLEEGIQNFTGGAAQNYAIQSSANDTRRIGDDLGGQTAEGAILGLGSAAGVKAPGTIGVLPVKGAITSAKSVVDFAAKRGEAAQAADAKIDLDKVEAGVQDAVQAAPAVTTGLQQLADESGQGQNEDTIRYVNRAASLPSLAVDDIKRLSPVQKESLMATAQDMGGRPDRFTAIMSMARTILDPEASKTDKASAALFVGEQVANLQDLLESTPEFLKNRDQADPRFEAFDAYMTKFKNIMAVPEFAKALDEAAKPDLIDEDVINDDNARNLAGQAIQHPENVNPDFASKVLFQIDKGDIPVTPEDKKAIQAAFAVQTAAKEHAEQVGLKAPEIVSKQIAIDGGPKDWQLSMEARLRQFNNARQSGDTQAAQKSITALNMFAKSLANKVDALNTSAAQNKNGLGPKIKYESSRENNTWINPKGQYTASYHSGREGSVNFATRVHADATALATFANNMSEIYPEYNLPKIEVAPLVQAPKAAPVKEEAPQSVAEPKKMETPVQETKATPEPAMDETQVIKDQIVENQGKKERRAVQDEIVELPGKAARRQAERDAQVIADEKVEQVGKAERRAAERSTVQPVEEPSAPITESIRTVFPNLVDINETTGQNQFYNAYSLPKTPRSRITQLVNPIKDLISLMKTPNLLVEFMGQDTKYTPPSEAFDAMSNILALGDGMLDALNERFGTKEGKNLLKALREGRDANRFREGKNLNLLQRTAKGGLEYNKTLIQGAILAGINHAINGEKQKVLLSSQDIAEITGMPLDQVSDDIVDQFNRGQSVDEFKRALSQGILDYWGVNKNRNTDDTQVQGIVEGVAGEIIHALDAVGLVEAGYTTGTGENLQTFGSPIVIRYETTDYEGNVNRNGFTQNRINFDMRDEALQEDINLLGSGARLLDSALLVDQKKALGAHIGAPNPSPAPRTQLRSQTENAPQQREALAAAAKVAYLPNIIVHDFVRDMGWEFFQKFMGGRQFTKGDLHPQYERSLEGKNRTLKASFDNVLNHMKDVVQHASKLGLEVAETPTFYDFNMSKVGRMQMQGNNTPQSDKLAREVFMPTRSILDMTKEADADKFWLTIAQGLGIKTEKAYRADAVAEVKSRIEKDYSSIIIDMVAWQREGGKPSSTLGDRIISAMGNDATMHGLQSLLSVAKLLKAAQDKEDISKFETMSYLEADGKTNGPIMTVALFAARINSDIIRVLRKGGISLGEAGKSLNAYINDGQDEDHASDLYQSGTVAASQFQDEFRATLLDQPKALARLNTFQKILNALDTNIELVGDVLHMKRGVIKNPMTISIYGSGVDGIAGKVVEGLMGTIYKMSSNKQSLDEQTYEGFTADLDKLLSEQIGLKDGTVTFSEPKGSDKSRDQALSPRQFNALKSHVRVLFVNQLHKGIDSEILTHVLPSTDTLQKSTQLQSLVLTYAYKQAVYEKLAEKMKSPDYRKGDWLSQKEHDEVLASLDKLSPIIKTGTQNFFIAGSEKGNLVDSFTLPDGTKITPPESFGEDMSGRFRSPAYNFGPSPAGVKGVPSLVIGTGDGMIMQNFFATIRNAIKNALPVFDGINFSAKDFDDGSRQVNEAVWRAMTANPMKAVAESFNTFMANDPSAYFDNEALRADISRTYYNKRNVKAEEILTKEQAFAYFQNIASDLDGLSQELEARNVTLQEFTTSIDQMASAESPFTQEGTLPGSADAEEMADIFNQRFEENLAAIREGKRNAPAIERANNEVMTSLIDTTTPLDSGARLTTIPSLQVWADNAASMLSGDQKSMLNAALKNLKDSGYQIIFGNRDQINEYEANNYPEYLTSVDYLGKVVPEVRHIYVVNPSGETLLHELIHASTLDKVIAHYANQASLSAEDSAAVARIESIMTEWVGQTTEADSDQLGSVRQTVLGQIQDALSTGNKAVAVNEFMAWTLSNQKLIDGAKQVALKNPLSRIVEVALKAIKQLIWGGKAPKVSNDIYSNLRFNTRILMKTPTPTELLRADIRKVSLFQSIAFGTSDRLSTLRQRFADKLAGYIDAPYQGPQEANPTPERIKEIAKAVASQQPARIIEVSRSQAAAQTLSDNRVAGIFHMTPQASSTFQMVYAALMTGVKMNTNSLSRVQDIYDHVIKGLKVEDLMADPLSTNPADRYAAQEQFDVITGAYASAVNAEGISDRLPTFLALSMVDDNFRKALSELKVPKSVKDTSGTFDAALDNMGNRALDAATAYWTGDHNTKNVREALDVLSMKISEVTSSDALFWEQYTVGGVDKIDSVINSTRNRLSEKLYDVSNKAVTNATNNVTRNAARLVRLGASLIHDERASIAVAGWTATLDQKENLTAVRELLAEIVGRTAQNAGIFDMINEVRAAVQQVRQQFREKLPKQLAKQFTRDLTDVEKTHLFRGLGKTDAAVLYERFGVDGTLDLIRDPARLQAQVATLESAISAQAPTRTKKLIQKSKQLAQFMNSGAQGVNLLRNAHAVASLFGEVGQARKVDPELVKNIDALTSLYSIQGLDPHVQQSLADLSTNETAGMQYLLSYLVGTRKDENTSITTDIARDNNYKGYIPSINKSGGSLIVANLADAAKYRVLGYDPVKLYQGSSADRSRWTKQYYYSPLQGKATYNQGVLQTVHQTANGVQPNTGFSVSGIAGRITDPRKVAEISRLVPNQRATPENLLPVYKNGKVFAYERSIDPAMETYLDKSTGIFDMTGVWRGRQFEEVLAKQYNSQLIDKVHASWLEAKKQGATSEFVDLTQSTDPTHQDTWDLIPDDVKADIKSKFGRDGFPIRRGEINDVVGARSASIGDFWTGQTRLSDKTAERVRDIAIGIFDFAGDFNPKLKGNAYSKLVQFERTWQSLVTELKVMIVVKSVIVPVTNAVSNVYQLMARGIPITTIAKGMGAKMTETNDYIKRRGQEVTLDADLQSAKGRNDTVAIRKLTNQIAAIKDSYKRMSIWPLIEAGEFTAIADGGVSNDDLRLSNWLDKATRHIPDGLQTTYRNAVMTKDTSLFKGLATAVQYSDFLAKAVLYDNLISRKRLTHVDALAKVNEEFVNYNRFAGRLRSYTESMGLIWFWNFKLRSIKTAISMMRENPARALLLGFMPPHVPFLGNVGDPIADNMASVILDGKLGNSIGPAVGLRAPTLLPWYSLLR